MTVRMMGEYPLWQIKHHVNNRIMKEPGYLDRGLAKEMAGTSLSRSRLGHTDIDVYQTYNTLTPQTAKQIDAMRSAINNASRSSRVLDFFGMLGHGVVNGVRAVSDFMGIGISGIGG